MNLSQFMPALQVPIDGIFIGDFWGFLLALPVALFLAFWMSAVKNRTAVVVGAFAGALLGFIIILGWVGTLIYDTPLPDANPVGVFFGSLLFCSALGLGVAIILVLIISRNTQRHYRRQAVVQQ